MRTARSLAAIPIAAVAVAVAALVWDRPAAGYLVVPVLAAPVALLAWWEARLLTQGLLALARAAEHGAIDLRGALACFRLRAGGLVAQPLAGTATCVATTAGALFALAGHGAPTAAIAVGALLGGAALRLALGTAVMLSVMPALPTGLRATLGDGLANAMGRD